MRRSTVLEDEIFHRIEKLRPNLLTLVQGLVRIPSENPPGNETEVVNFLSDVVSEIGLDVERYEIGDNRVNLAAELKGKGAGHTLLFNGHTDVVPAGPRELWSKDPFAGDFDGTRIWGRGTSDMKGALGSIVIALKALVDVSAPVRGDVKLHAVADEEVNSLGTKYMIAKNLAKSDLAIVAEGSTANGEIYIRPSVRGICWVTLRTEGRAAHASNPASGVNAVLGMCRLLMALNETGMPYGKHKLLPSPTISPGTMIRGGVKTNVIPPECFADVDIRTVPGMGKDTTLTHVSEIIGRVEKANPGLTANITNVVWGAAAEIPDDHELVQLAKRATMIAVGKEPVFRGGYGTNDSRLLINEAGIPTLCGFGPGDDVLGNAHGVDENVTLDVLVAFAKIYALMALWVCG